MWEGGVRGVGFVTGFGLSPAVRGTTSSALLHVSDWVPTLVTGVAGLAVHSPPHAPPVDGVDAWAAISQGRPSSRKEILLNLCPDFAVLAGAQVKYGWQQSAIRHGEMKLIWGLPGDEDRPQCKAPGCKNGWQLPPALDNSSWPAPDAPEPAVFSPGVWVRTRSPAAVRPALLICRLQLFNLTSDIAERVNLAEEQPELVTFLQRRISAYNASHVWQANQFNPPLDPRSNPEHFRGVWSPWLPNSEERVQ